MGSCRWGVGLLLIALVGCSSSLQDGPPDQDIDVSLVSDAVPKYEPLSRYGNPTYYEEHGRRYHVLHSAVGFHQQGFASWYGSAFHGRLTAMREPYDMLAMTAAHRTLPLPSYLRVRNLDNGREVVVRVNDRGPFHGDRIVDLSYAAAKNDNNMIHKHQPQIQGN